jgi:predicted RNA-binding Zn-ribbon protein involved in translation (DUF1610 family)
MQTVSIKCKLQVPTELRSEIDRTLMGFADACNQILEVAKREKCWNTTKLHHLVYKPVREATGLKANHVCQAIRRVIGNAKAVKQIHKFRPTSISLDIRTFQFIEELQTVGVTLMCGRVKFKLSIGNYQLALLKGQSPTAATLNKTKRGDYYINICVDLPTQPPGKTPKVSGIRDSLNEQPRNKTERRRTNNWAFYKLRMFVQYKAVIAGVLVVFVPPAYTSKTCSRCGHVHPETDRKKSYRSGKKFKCGHCGFEHDADINAAKNIAALGLPVSQPESPGMTCQLQGQMSLFGTFDLG